MVGANILLGRGQLRDLTGIEDATLDYWSRTGVLRAADGGGGKGQHRRFGASEVMLAGILAELMRFGVAAASLAQLAARFHDSEDWIRSRGVQDCVVPVASLIENYHDWATEGFARVPDSPFIDRLMKARPREAIGASGERERLLSWPQIIQYHRYMPGGEYLSDQAVQVATETKINDYLPHARRFSALQAAPRSKRIVQEIVFSKDQSGEWREYVQEPERILGRKNATNIENISHLVSYFRVDLSALRRRVWEKKPLP